MPFIHKDTQVVINSKLTTLGRQLLASGKLNFSKFALGDSEINYKFLREGLLNPEDNTILRPLDEQPNLKHFILPFSDSTDVMSRVNAPLALPTTISNPVDNIGMFNGDSTTGFTLKTTIPFLKEYNTVVTSSINGTNVITLGSGNTIEVGEYLLIAWKGPNAVSNNNGLGVMEKAKPTQYIWYKVVGISGATVTLDKKVPNFGGAGGTSYVYVFPKGDSVRNYYTSPVMSTSPTQVWNFTIVYSDSMEGAHTELQASGYGSKSYVGLANYLGLTKLKSVGVIHYSNYSRYSPYGEGFNGTSFKVDLPTIMYHRTGSGNLGATLQASGELKVINGNKYYDLVDSAANVVGKVFNNLKLAIIEDQEIIAALSMKSNRNWSLPDMEDLYPNAEETESDFYFTYALETSNGTESYNASSTLGFNTTLHCQYIHKIEASKIRQIEFSFKPEHLTFFRDASTIGSSSHTGFSARKMKLLMQRVPKGTKPLHNQWVSYDYTPHMLNYATWSNGAIPMSAMSSVHRITETMYTTALANATTNGYYNLNSLEESMPGSYFTANTLPTLLGDAHPGFTFGEESILIGNVSVEGKAEIFKSNFVITLTSGMYNSTLNPTWIPGTNVYISEVGIYDEEGNLVLVGKLSHPVEKVSSSIITITLDIDF